MINIDNNSGSDTTPKQENAVTQSDLGESNSQITADSSQIPFKDNPPVNEQSHIHQQEPEQDEPQISTEQNEQTETTNPRKKEENLKAPLNLKPLKDTYKKYNIKHKDFPPQIFINQEYYKKFNVSKAKPEFNEINEVSDLVEIAFKNKRRQLYSNNKKLPFVNYQYVVVEVENGLDLGTVTAFGKCAEAKLKLFYKDKEPQYSILRHAKIEDMHRYKHNLDTHANILERAREWAEKLNLDMKITDAEWQFDQQRLTVYFTSPLRIDFRQLVKELAKAFKTRIELRQISTREDAKRIGGMGSCGRALCCASFAHENSHVTLDHARVQQLSNNVTKLSGYCGRLKCCLLYEYNTYIEILSKYPSMNAEIEFPEGKAKILKADIFKKLVHAYIPASSTYKTISFEDFAELNDNGKVFTLHDDNHKNCEIRKMFIDPDEDDIEELKKLEG